MECDFSEDEMILTFCRRMKASCQDSIDASLEREPSFLRVGKASIVVQLLLQEFNQFAWDRSEADDWYRTSLPGCSLATARRLPIIGYRSSRSTSIDLLSGAWPASRRRCTFREFQVCCWPPGTMKSSPERRLSVNGCAARPIH
jgi:hypothetical protein